MPRQVKARPRPGRGPGQGVTALSLRRVAELASSRQNATRFRPPVAPPPRPPVGSQAPAEGLYAEFEPRKLPWEEVRAEASPLRPWEPIGARSLGARALTRSVLRPLPPALPSSICWAHLKALGTTPELVMAVVLFRFFP